MTRRQKRELIKIITTAVLLICASVFFAVVPLPDTFVLVRLAVWVLIYLFIGYGYLIKAVKNVFRGRLLDENFLMATATIGAFFIGEYTEAVAVMLFYSIGELFQSCAVGKSRRSIAELMDMRSDFARVLRDGKAEETDPSLVKKGELIIVKPGEKIPLDGTVTDGFAEINSAYITGESMPVAVAPGDAVISGTVNLDGVLTIRTDKEFEDSTVSKILELVENSSLNKSRTEKFITRFANVYTPCVVIAAVLLAVIPSVISGNWSAWIKRALVFLVVSCPCALVISVPMSFFGGIGCASKKGILIKGADFLEKLSTAGTFIFDKTGTITSGKFKTERIVTAEGVSAEDFISLLFTAESYSNHPVSESVCAYCREKGAKLLSTECRVEELAGLGVRCRYDGHTVYAGNRRLAEKHTDDELPKTEETAVFVVADGRFAGFAELTDEIKPGVRSAVEELKSLCNAKTVILSGDKVSSVELACARSGIDSYVAELLPAGKLEETEKIMKNTDGVTVYTGDGINDSPVLARSDVGIAMGGVGQDAAIEAADIVIMDDDIAKIPVAVKISRKTMGIVRQNIVFALVVKFAVLVLSVFGIASMWLAVFADVGVSAIAIVNAMRTLTLKAKK